MKGFLDEWPAVSLVGTQNWLPRHWTRKPDCRGLTRYKSSYFCMKADAALKNVRSQSIPYPSNASDLLHNCENLRLLCRVRTKYNLRVRLGINEAHMALRIKGS